MERSDLEELRQEFRRFNSKEFLNATIAVCVLSPVLALFPPKPPKNADCFLFYRSLTAT